MDTLLNLIAEISGEDVTKLNETDELIGDISFDSLMIMDLVVSIKNQFELKDGLDKTLSVLSQFSYFVGEVE